MGNYLNSFPEIPNICESLHQPLARQRINSLANSLSPLQWTVDTISVHFSGLSLLAVDLSPRWVKSTGARYEPLTDANAYGRLRQCIRNEWIRQIAVKLVGSNDKQLSKADRET